MLTTEYQNRPNMGKKQHEKTVFCPKGNKNLRMSYKKARRAGYIMFIINLILY